MNSELAEVRDTNELLLSIETAKNLEDLFQIKSAIMSQKLEDVGGRNGVMEILDLSLDAYKRKSVATAQQTRHLRQYRLEKQIRKL